MIDIHDFAIRLEQDGVDSVESEIAQIVAAARRLGVRPVAAAVAADPTEPRPARVRALGLLLAALPVHPPVPSDTRHAVTLAA